MSHVVNGTICLRATRRLFLAPLHRYGFLVEGQNNTEDRPFSRLAFYVDPAAMVLDDPVTDRKPESCPVTIFFCGEKGLKDLLQVLLRNTDTRICKFYHCLMSPDGMQTYPEIATLRHGLKRVIDNIDKDLFHLIRIHIYNDRGTVILFMYFHQR